MSCTSQALQELPEPGSSSAESAAPSILQLPNHQPLTAAVSLAHWPPCPQPHEAGKDTPQRCTPAGGTLVCLTATTRRGRQYVTSQDAMVLVLGSCGTMLQDTTQFKPVSMDSVICFLFTALSQTLRNGKTSHVSALVRFAPQSGWTSPAFFKQAAASCTYPMRANLTSSYLTNQKSSATNFHIRSYILFSSVMSQANQVKPIRALGNLPWFPVGFTLRHTYSTALPGVGLLRADSLPTCDKCNKPRTERTSRQHRSHGSHLNVCRASEVGASLSLSLNTEVI